VVGGRGGRVKLSGGRRGGVRGGMAGVTLLGGGGWWGSYALALMPKCKHWYSYFFYRGRVTLCVGGEGEGGCVRVGVDAQM
jgi:hypothetical protein